MISELILHGNLETVFQSKEIADKILALGKAEYEAFTKEKEGSEKYEKQRIIYNDDSGYIKNEAYIESWDFQSGNSFEIAKGDTIGLVIGNKHLETKVIGVGSYGTILHCLTNNAVYKLLKFETKIKDDDTMVYQKYSFQKICKEITIQNIISYIDYVNDEGKKQKCASPILAIYKLIDEKGKTAEVGINKHINSKKDEVFAKTQMILLEMNPMLGIEEPIKFDTFISIFKSFLQILNSIRMQNITFSHCDVKLNNMMYKTDGNLRLIDFGYSSIYFKLQKTDKTVEDFMLLSPNDECGWVKEKNYNYPEKDVLQLLLSLSAFELDEETSSFQTFALDLFDHPAYPYIMKIEPLIHDLIVNGDHLPDFTLGYNFKLKLRKKLRKHLKQAFIMYSPDWILKNFDTILQRFKDKQNPKIKKDKQTKVPYINTKSLKNNNNSTRKANNINKNVPGKAKNINKNVTRKANNNINKNVI